MKTRAATTAFLLLLIWGCGDSEHRTALSVEDQIRDQAKELADAMLKNDYVAIVRSMPETLVASMGGPAAVAGIMQKTMLDANMTLLSVDVGENVLLARGDAIWLAIVPTVLVGKIQSDPVTIESYLLGQSADQGTTWKFREGSWAVRQTMQKKYHDVAKELIFPVRRQILGDPSSGGFVMTAVEIKGVWQPDPQTAGKIRDLLEQYEQKPATD